VAAHIVIALGQTVIVYGIAAAFGGRFHGSVLLGMLIILLSVTTFVGLGFFFGAHFSRSTEDVNGPVSAFGVPLLVLGGTFFPPQMLPDFLLQLAHLDPIFHMNQALKPVSALGAGVADIALHLMLLMVFAAVALTLGTHAYGALLQRERRMA
jgi:ABC-2 type transport system permease protein